PMIPPPLQPLGDYMKGVLREEARRQRPSEEGPSASASPTPPAPVFFAGLDLGQQRDYTALAIVQRTEEAIEAPADAPAGNAPARPAKVRKYVLTYLHRWPLGSPYGQIVEDVTRGFDEPPLRSSMLAIDATGVGRAVVEQFTRARPAIQARLTPIVLHAGG